MASRRVVVMFQDHSLNKLQLVEVRTDSTEYLNQEGYVRCRVDKNYAERMARMKLPRRDDPDSEYDFSMIGILTVVHDMTEPRIIWADEVEVQEAVTLD